MTNRDDHTMIRQISLEPRKVDIRHYFIPWTTPHNRGIPVMVQMQNSHDMFVPIFSSVENLHALMAQIQMPYISIKKIDDAVEFLDSLPLRLRSGVAIRVIIDPHQNEVGKVRFFEILRDNGNVIRDLGE